MAGGGTSGVDVFDVRKVRRFVELMNEHDLAEIDLRQGEQRIRLRRGQEPVLVAPAVQQGVPVAPIGGGGGTGVVPAGEVAGTTEPAQEDANAVYVTSPMVGTFYTSSSPDAAPFVKIGDQVGPESVICIIEAMKVFNEIPAECSGKIISMLVENGDAVEFGQKLFKLDSTS
ncbi:MAG: acetyl-CoA carboxylase biotin carboxyl carrier protein [Pirellulales bacterium]